VGDEGGVVIAALYVDPKGPYPDLGVDCWDESRDARTYSGPYPVVAHPPCGRWCGLAKLNEKRWGAKVGEDGGCFKSALLAVARFGGVLEHPAFSLAWKEFALPRPGKFGWRESGEFWVCEVWQSAYGHLATKRTWLLYKGATRPAEMIWTKKRGSHQIGGGIHTGNRLLPRLRSGTHLSPVSFASKLVDLAESSR
jgi:hypothetical protein